MADSIVSINVAKLKNAIYRDINAIGVTNTIKDYSFKALNLVVLFKIFRGMSISDVNPNFMIADEKYECKFLTPEDLIAFSRSNEFELGEEFVCNAIKKGDECYAILDGNFLAAYGWYSNGATVVSDELQLRFNQDYIYMYKGFTHRNYRGQRLHAIGMTRALNEYRKRGMKGIVSYVEENNYRSLQSVYRMGYADFGKVYITKLFGKYFIHHSPGCRKFGFEVFEA